MSEDSENLLDQIIKRINSWLLINKENQKAVKPLTKILQVLEWAKEKLDTMPQQFRNSQNIGSYYQQLQNTQRALDQFLPNISYVDVNGLKTISSSTDGIIPSALLSYGSAIFAGCESKWIDDRTEEYHRIQ
jgi:hypothetical protein